MSLQIRVKVTPHASQNQVVGFENELLLVRVKGTPQKGEVNEGLIELLAKELKIAKSKIELVSGHTSRFKKLKIEGISQLQFEQVLGLSERLLE